MIRVYNVWFEYDARRPPVFQQLSLEHRQGALVLLGPTGAGKSTLLRLLASFLVPQRGTIQVAGVDPVRAPLDARRLIGYVPQEIGLPGDLTFAEYLTTLARLDTGAAEVRREVQRVMAAVHLEAFAGRRLRLFSGGMKRRALLAQALLKNPAVLLVDTPTAGLDPYEQIMVLELLRDVGRERLLVVATNLPDEAVELSDRIVILDRGRVVAEVAADGLAEAAAGHVFQVPWTFRDRVDGMVVPTARPEEVLVVTAAPPHQVARPVASSPELGYLYLLWAARRARRSPVP